MNFEHQPARSPYRASGPIFVQEHAVAAAPAPDEIPQSLRLRLLSLRAYDGAGLMTAAEVVEGRDLEPLIAQLLADADVAYLHAHYARRGCYAARLARALGVRAPAPACGPRRTPSKRWRRGRRHRRCGRPFRTG